MLTLSNDPTLGYYQIDAWRCDATGNIGPEEQVKFPKKLLPDEDLVLVHADGETAYFATRLT